MNYEKKYKEALEKIKRYVTDEFGCTRLKPSDIFSELKESEDEKIRKALISFLKSPFVNENITDEKVTPWIVWLEKQGEQKPVISYDALREGIAHFGITQYQIDNWLKKYVVVEKQDEQKPVFGMKTPEESLGIDSETYNKIVDECIYGEQKPAWSEEDEHRIKDTIYFLDTAKKHYASTVELDACIDWLKSLKDRVGCEVNCTTKQVMPIGTNFKLEKMFPELAELENERMRNAAINACKYMVDNFENSTKQYEDAIAWLEKQGKQSPIDVRTTGYWHVEDVEQKPAWSEEDEKHFSWLIEYLSQSAGLYDNLIDWLKSLKDRVGCEVNCTTKQEWKQENTGDLTDFENTMMHIGRSFFGENAGLDPNDTNTIKEQANLLMELIPKQEWNEENERTYKSVLYAFEHNYPLNNEQQKFVKSFKDRYTWKPSDGQIEILDMVLTNESMDDNIARILRELREQLKKLKE